MSTLLEVDSLKKHFALRRRFWGGPRAHVYAVDGVSFHIDKGETLALVGESGCGKSTVGRAVLRLFEITAGRVVLDGLRIDDLAAGALRPLRRRMQVVFQDPFSSLNPRMRVSDILAEPIRNFGLVSSPADLDARIDALLDGAADATPLGMGAFAVGLWLRLTGKRRAHCASFLSAKCLKRVNAYRLAAGLSELRNSIPPTIVD